ncbi:MAG: hypothetical protein ACPLM9_06945 [Methanomassiliicoccales archaeon]|jgi:hypothetical protein
MSWRLTAKIFAREEVRKDKEGRAKQYLKSHLNKKALKMKRALKTIVEKFP